MTEENVTPQEEPVEEISPEGAVEAQSVEGPSEEAPKEEPVVEPSDEEPVYDVPEGDITSDDKLWAALGYPIPLVAIIALLLEDKKERPFIRFHAIQSLAFNIVLWVLIVLLSIPTVGCVSILWLITLWPAYDSYQGNFTEIPVVTNFIKKQGWV
ncbi:DUF4870 domain-containing protein [Chloroflexota bacterium]